MSVDISVIVSFDTEIEEGVKNKGERANNLKSAGYYSIRPEAHNIEKTKGTPNALYVVIPFSKKGIEFSSHGIYWDEQRNRQIVNEIIGWIKKQFPMARIEYADCWDGAWKGFYIDYNKNKSGKYVTDEKGNPKPEDEMAGLLKKVGKKFAELFNKQG